MTLEQIIHNGFLWLGVCGLLGFGVLFAWMVKYGIEEYRLNHECMAIGFATVGGFLFVVVVLATIGVVGIIMGIIKP